MKSHEIKEKGFYWVIGDKKEKEPYVSEVWDSNFCNEEAEEYLVIQVRCMDYEQELSNLDYCEFIKVPSVSELI